MSTHDPTNSGHLNPHQQQAITTDDQGDQVQPPVQLDENQNLTYAPDATREQVAEFLKDVLQSKTNDFNSQAAELDARTREVAALQATNNSQNATIQQAHGAVANLNAQILNSQHNIQQLTARLNSTTLVSEAAPAVEGGSSLRLKEPDTFAGCGPGSKAAVRNFLSQCTLQFTIRPKTFKEDATKIAYACTFLRGDAQEWIQPYLDIPRESLPEVERSWLGSWAGFKAKMNLIFGDPDLKNTCARKITTLRQVTGVPVYTAEFRRLAFQLDWGDDALRHHYYEGLKDTIKDALALAAEPRTFEELVVAAERVGNRQHIRSLEKGRANSSSTNSSSPSSRSSNRTTNHVESAPASTPTADATPVAMEVDSARRSTNRGPLTEAEKAYRRPPSPC